MCIAIKNNDKCNYKFSIYKLLPQTLKVINFLTLRNVWFITSPMTSFDIYSVLKLKSYIHLYFLSPYQIVMKTLEKNVIKGKFLSDDTNSRTDDVTKLSVAHSLISFFHRNKHLIKNLKLNSCNKLWNIYVSSYANHGHRPKGKRKYKLLL